MRGNIGEADDDRKNFDVIKMNGVLILFRYDDEMILWNKLNFTSVIFINKVWRVNEQNGGVL